MNVGKFKMLYESEYILDHCVVYDEATKKWHMFGIHGDQKSFIHLTSDTLTGTNWKREEDFTYNDGSLEIWAPHIIRNDNKYWMFYTVVGNPRQIVLSVSEDLYNWQHYSNNPVLARKTADGHDGKNKDCMLFEHNGEWLMYHSMVQKFERGAEYWCVGCSKSTDLLSWSEPMVVFDENQPGDPGVESPFVIKRNDAYYLFLSAVPWPAGGVNVYKSKNPFCWRNEDFLYRNNAIAIEVVKDLDGRWYMTNCGRENGGWLIAPIDWEED